MSAQQLNEAFCEAPAEENYKALNIFKNVKDGMILDSIHILGILRKDQLNLDAVKVHYAPAVYSVEYLRKALGLLSILDHVVDETSIRIYLPKEKALPLLIQVDKCAEKVYAIAPQTKLDLVGEHKD